MKNLKRILPMLLALVMVFSLVIGTSAYAAETVKVICPYGAGGVADLVTREYAKAANNVQSDYNFIVENLTGGDGFVANATFSEEAPDTKDLLVMGYGVCYRVDAAAKYDTEEVDFDLPGSHGLEVDGTTPLGGGALLLIGLGAAYAFGKRRREE